MGKELVDLFGRVHRDFRISVTDRCNFRCQYCMPEEGLDWLKREELLTFEEITRVTKILVENYGIDSVRLTGGEPTLRANLSDLISMLSDLPIEIALTTNGITLEKNAHLLRSAGLSRINISIDSLKAEKFKEITHRDEMQKVITGIEASLEAGLLPVKINVVAMRGINDDEILDFAKFGRDRSVIVRFIEFMPLDADEKWSTSAVLSQEEIFSTINSVYPLEAVERSNAPASRFRYLDGQGEIGIVASVTQKFCGTCDRIRITADGQFRNCLFSNEELNLKEALRSGSSDREICDLLDLSVLAKREGHGIGNVDFIRPARSMSQIGG
ncbi:MAG: GTP 3',8-cyclase MoaA [Acidimicrobiales bacterium]|nr:GTP 3',8-cyclase MoaA [Acidimicrobiales bacterium]MDP6284710.1 GTP 3',8-cyclase MoaA [Acidimicrobiales bacterium]HJL91890.1 GTP 3',8-cyclase MoaA [Acidimicrobiales bacterium]HJO41439.1 GTP 3',8-cyclase MoaA [Acidimicrobiales bacterium]